MSFGVKSLVADVKCCLVKQLRLPIFNSKIKYYNLRIVPGTAVFNKVTEFKKEFELTFGKLPLSGSKPHITLTQFKMNSKYEDLLIQTFNELSKGKGFKVNIDGFGVMEGSRSLLLKVAKNEAIDKIHQQLQILRTQQLKRKLYAFTIAHNPHMIISKATGKRMLFESLQHFLSHNYFEEIQVNELTLVTRAKYKPWELRHEIKLIV